MLGFRRAALHCGDESSVFAIEPLIKTRAHEIRGSMPDTTPRSGSTIRLTIGPTRPSVAPGQPFPTSPLAVANSPVDVRFKGVPAEVVWAGGFPGAIDGYQVNFRVPEGVSVGLARLQLSVAWISGAEVRIPVQ